MKNLLSIFCGLTIAFTAQMGPAQTIQPTQFNFVPSRIVGQPILQQQGAITAIAENLVEGREFNNPQAIAIDTSASPPILYVADFANNRVLAWKNALGFTKGDFADKVIGQRDFFSINGQGPAVSGSSLSTGLAGPIALAVDKSGNLYVADAGNNRIVRYPAPLQQTGDLLTIDLIIGQPDLNSGRANQGLQAPTEKTLALNNGNNFGAGIAIDASGNLWVSDTFNNRVLRYPASSVGSGAAFDPAADLVLGQSDFVTRTIPANAQTAVKCGNTAVSSTACNKTILSLPTALAFDPKGRLFVADGLNRVVVFTPPLASGQLISRIMGIDPGTPPNPPPTVSASTLGPPGNITFVGSNPYVTDTLNARVLGYDPFDQWADEGTAFSPPAKVVVGQPSFQGFQSNRGFPQPSNITLAGPQNGGPQPNSLIPGPAAAAFAGTELFVADSGNNRVIVFPQQGTNNFGPATRLLGQLDFQYNSLNLIEGREFGFFPNVGSCAFSGVLPFASSGGGVTIDNSSNPPHMYVADPVNNRVLGYLDARKLNAGAFADIVIGQPDLKTAEINYPLNNGNQTTDQGLWSPEDVAVDSSGNLYVADTCNARVLRFSAPFAQPFTSLPHANLVLGQTSFFGQPVKDLSRQTMRSSYGLAFSFTGNLVVSDPVANRILHFKKPSGGDFKSGDPAANVFGQKDFNSTGTSVFNNPRGLAIDPDDQLYVADTFNNRVAILPNVTIAGDNPPVLFSIPQLSSPVSVAVNQATREVWVTNTNLSQTVRYPNFQTILSNPTPSAVLNNTFAAVSVALDPFGNPVIAEALTNRISFFYPAIDFTSSAGGVAGRFSGNGANYLARFAPGMIASIFAFPNSHFGDQTATYSNLPPTTLGDVQVTVAGIPAPLFYVSPSQINLQIPAATPTGGLQEIQVIRASTSQVLASFLFRIDIASPGLFTATSSGVGQISAINADDNSINGSTHPCKAGSIISLYGTGPGLLTSQPPDGQPATGAVNTVLKPQVIINGTILPDSDVSYSGAAPGYVGLWQINAKVPTNAPPGDVRVVVTYAGFPSNQDSSGNLRVTTIRVNP